LYVEDAFCELVAVSDAKLIQELSAAGMNGILFRGVIVMVWLRTITALVLFSVIFAPVAPLFAAEVVPVPPFAPHFLNPPRRPQEVTPLPVPAAGVPNIQPSVETPMGPAFNWSSTENYLILGTDRRAGGGGWRTDTVMILGLDRELNRAAVFSIPRDLYVQIPEYGWGRINQVDYLGEQRNGFGGGPQLMSQVLSSTLGISTGHWVRLQMDGFVDIVDAVGGVTVHLDCPFFEPILNASTNAWDYFVLPAGDVKLDGESAYWFVRLRYRESDIGRGRRQRQFLWALRDQLLNTNLVTRLPELWNAFQNFISSDLSLPQLLELANYGLSLDAANVRAAGLTLNDLQNYTTPEGAAVLRIADPARVRNIVEGIWSAPAMVDTNRQDSNNCTPLPPGVTIDLPAEPVEADEPALAASENTDTAP
jgi:LCP family protein required for cell wall assembly